MSSRFWNPWPEAGDIVDCRFPEAIGTPGPKERPALVLQVEESTEDASGCAIVVAYATSQRTARIYPGEFVIAASSVSGLTADTKFDLTNRHLLPFDDKWFGSASGAKPAHPRRGQLDLTNMDVKRRLHAAISEIAAPQKK